MTSFGLGKTSGDSLRKEVTYNLRLSQSRAQAVVDTLARLGADSSRLTAKGYGQEKPLVPNTTDANRAKNRRVQLIIMERGK